MDGIFGIGIPELLIIFLLLFVVGGPANTAKWARELGKQMRKLRQVWAQMMAELENELGPEGKEIIDATRELSQSAYEMRKMNAPRKLMEETVRMIEQPVIPKAPPKLDPIEKGETEEPEATKYQAWVPQKPNADE